MKRSPMPPRTARLKSKTRIKPRSAKKFRKGQSQNAHTVTGGTGRKADADTIVPLCGRCHPRYDQHQPPFDSDGIRTFIKSLAAKVEGLWRAHVGQVHGTPTQEVA